MFVGIMIKSNRDKLYGNELPENKRQIYIYKSYEVTIRYFVSALRIARLLSRFFLRHHAFSDLSIIDFSRISTFATWH